MIHSNASKIGEGDHFEVEYDSLIIAQSTNIGRKLNSRIRRGGNVLHPGLYGGCWVLGYNFIHMTVNALLQSHPWGTGAGCQWITLIGWVINETPLSSVNELVQQTRLTAICVLFIIIIIPYPSFRFMVLSTNTINSRLVPLKGRDTEQLQKRKCRVKLHRFGLLGFSDLLSVSGVVFPYFLCD